MQGCDLGSRRTESVDWKSGNSLEDAVGFCLVGKGWWVYVWMYVCMDGWMDGWGT